MIALCSVGAVCTFLYFAEVSFQYPTFADIRFPREAILPTQLYLFALEFSLFNALGYLIICEFRNCTTIKVSTDHLSIPPDIHS